LFSNGSRKSLFSMPPFDMPLAIAKATDLISQSFLACLVTPFFVMVKLLPLACFILIH